MQDFYTEGSKDTPKIDYHADEHRMSISGYSFPENTFTYYSQVINIIDDVIEKSDEFILTMKLIYFNSSSAKVFIDIFDKLEEAAEKGNLKVTINWLYDKDNESIFEYGEDFGEDFEFVQFNLVELPPE